MSTTPEVVASSSGDCSDGLGHDGEELDRIEADRMKKSKPSIGAAGKRFLSSNKLIKTAWKYRKELMFVLQTTLFVSRGVHVIGPVVRMWSATTVGPA
jgi:hypothetical protein